MQVSGKFKLIMKIQNFCSTNVIKIDFFSALDTNFTKAASIHGNEIAYSYSFRIESHSKMFANKMDFISIRRLLEHRTCPMCKLDVLKFYGFVVGAQNQIINLNGFILGLQSPNEVSSVDSVVPSAPPPQEPANAIFRNQNHSTLTQTQTQTVDTHAIIDANDNDHRNDSIMRQCDQILAITSTSQSQNSSIFHLNQNFNHNDHLDVEGSSSSCSYNRCNNKISSANNTDNTQLSNCRCSNSQNCCNANVCSFSSIIDNTSHPNRSEKVDNLNDSSVSRIVYDI